MSNKEHTLVSRESYKPATILPLYIAGSHNNSVFQESVQK